MKLAIITENIEMFYTDLYTVYENHSIVSCALQVETFRVYTTSRTPLLCVMLLLLPVCV